MNELLQLAVDAHGGLARWNDFDKVSVQMLVGGRLWQLKGQDGVLNNSLIEVELRRQQGRYLDFNSKGGLETDFSNKRVAIVDRGSVVEELYNPRDSFKGHVLESKWTRLQLIYFGTYAMWEYLTIPFSLMLPGFVTNELSPWHEGGETWRRLQVVFPDDWAFHSRKQVLYFDKNGMVKRMDYDVEISGNIPAAQYVFDYREYQGIKLPTRRMVYSRDMDGQYIHEPLIVSIELLNVQFQ